MRSFFFLLPLLCFAANAAPIYKCTDESGRVSYSGEQCSGVADQKVLPSNSAPAPTSSMTMSTPAFGARLAYEWWKVGTSFMEGNFVVYNDNDYAIKDIEVECVHSGNSGTQLDRNVRTIYELVPAGGRKGVSGLQMGLIHTQATSTICSIISVKR